MAEADVGRILKWGERADSTVPGTGLGLAIASDLVGIYRGQLKIGRSTRLGGLSAVVTLAVQHEPEGATAAA